MSKYGLFSYKRYKYVFFAYLPSCPRCSSFSSKSNTCRLIYIPLAKSKSDPCHNVLRYAADYRPDNNWANVYVNRLFTPLHSHSFSNIMIFIIVQHIYNTEYLVVVQCFSIWISTSWCEQLLIIIGQVSSMSLSELLSRAHKTGFISYLTLL